MARISTTPSRAARCMPARSWCRRCWRPASGTGRTALRRCSASPSAPRPCAGFPPWCRRRCTRPAFIRPRFSASWARPPAFPPRSASTPKQIVDALGIAGSFASGIIEYLAEGAWTKRLHPGWAAQSGLRAALLARGGFLGPRTVFEGVHGLFHGFAHTTKATTARSPISARAG